MIKGMNRLINLNKSVSKSFSTLSEGPILINPETERFLKVSLNKPKALNALDLEMIRILHPQINNWNQSSSNVRAIWLQGEGGKAFCAGGDIKSLYDAKVSGDQSKLGVLETFFREEFELDYALTQMKPIQISVLDGIVMGGGVGISVHSPIRIATEQSVYAMPEAKIGFFTDVGGGYFLSRLRKNIGLYLGLTGARLKAKQLVETGVANYYVPRERLPELQNTLTKQVGPDFTLEQAKQIVSQFSEQVQEQYENEDEIEKLFSGEQYRDMYSNLQNSSSEFGSKTFKLLNGQNALSTRVIYEQITRAKKQQLSLKDALIIDYRISQKFMEGNDFFEGVRTVLVDRKDVPKWSYQSPLEVPDAEVESYFTPMKNIKELDI